MCKRDELTGDELLMVIGAVHARLQHFDELSALHPAHEGLPRMVASRKALIVKLNRMYKDD